MSTRYTYLIKDVFTWTQWLNKLCQTQWFSQRNIFVLVIYLCLTPFPPHWWVRMTLWSLLLQRLLFKVIVPILLFYPCNLGLGSPFSSQLIGDCGHCGYDKSHDVYRTVSGYLLTCIRHCWHTLHVLFYFFIRTICNSVSWKGLLGNGQGKAWSKKKSVCVILWHDINGQWIMSLWLSLNR